MPHRSFLDSFKAYEWEPSNHELASRAGLKLEDIIRFDTNASPYRPKSWLESLAKTLPSMDVNSYPDTSYRHLRRLVADYNSVEEDEIVITNGADEALDIITKSFVDPGSKVLISTPTYAYFKIAAQIMGAIPIQIPRLANFNDNVDSLIDESDDAALIILSNPNNPTGNLLKEDIVSRLLKETHASIIIDEAYFEFSLNSFKDLARREPRLTIVRTFSKGFSLAGARVGYMIASRDTSNILNKIRPPNSVGIISLALAGIALNDRKLMQERVDAIIKAREIAKSSLESLNGVTVFPSEGNFLLVKFENKSANEIHSKLLEKGMVVRNVSSVKGLENCLRFTVLTSDLNSRLYEALRSLV